MWSGSSYLAFVESELLRNSVKFSERVVRGRVALVLFGVWGEVSFRNIYRAG